MIVNSFRKQNKRKKRAARLKPPAREKNFVSRAKVNLTSEEKSQRRIDYETYLESEEWAEKRLKCILAAGEKCEVCEGKGPFHAHHYNYLNLKLQPNRFLDTPIIELLKLIKKLSDSNLKEREISNFIFKNLKNDSFMLSKYIDSLVDKDF
jgi:hypothetical protein